MNRCVHCCTQRYKLDDFVTGTKSGVITVSHIWMYRTIFFELGTETWYGVDCIQQFIDILLLFPVHFSTWQRYISTVKQNSQNCLH